MIATSTPTAFRHEALLYEGIDDFVESVAPFIADGVDRGEPVLVVVDSEKIALLESALGSDAESVQFADMGDVGRNPGRIIAAWQDFVEANSTDGVAVRGVGEPISTRRSQAELSECHRHEALLNVAFADGPPFWLVCPYDLATLDPEVIHEAEANHPFLCERGEHRPSSRARTIAQHVRPFDEALPASPTGAAALEVDDRDDVGRARTFAAQLARANGLEERRTEDAALVIGELVANSLRHAQTSALLKGWKLDGSIVFEVRDGGVMCEPLAGLLRPDVAALDGRGLWIAQQLSDLVQQRTVPDGNVVRVHFYV
jgi:anti-sigma regulatory factor (Ser/Thr protein kinase)